MGHIIYDEFDVSAEIRRDSFRLAVGDLTFTNVEYEYDDLDDMLRALAAVKKSKRYADWCAKKGITNPSIPATLKGRR